MKPSPKKLKETKNIYHKVVDHKNKRVYLKCESAITAMGIGALVEKYYPGYKGHLVSLNRLNEFSKLINN